MLSTSPFSHSPDFLSHQAPYFSHLSDSSTSCNSIGYLSPILFKMVSVVRFLYTTLVLTSMVIGQTIPSQSPATPIATMATMATIATSATSATSSLTPIVPPNTVPVTSMLTLVRRPPYSILLPYATPFRVYG